jgi:hypothetical protein
MAVQDIFMHHFALIFSKTRNLMLEISSEREGTLEDNFIFAGTANFKSSSNQSK